jgi:hypothetical protein
MNSMVQHCPRCQRANPASAVFCHFDGCLLQHGAAGAGAGQLLHEFIFPSGRRCRTFDELATGCYYEWEDARTLLHDGTFASFLAGIGRADLARTARESQGQADVDIALTNFVGALPATQVQGPKLGLNPRRLVIGPARVGEQRVARVMLLNEGRGLLQGKVTVADGASWLRIVDGSDDHTYPLKTGKEQPLTIRAETGGLTVGQNYSGKLTVVTNGGVAELPVRLDLVARPFARAPYQGAMDPRDLARKMRDNPHPGPVLLESGEIARWFASNGWAYPIAGATAPGLAAVQQYFEELGLAKAPQILISDQELRFRCTSPELVTGQVTIRSPARKLVYGRAESDAPWLKVTTPGVSGQVQAQIDFAIDTTLMDEDRTYIGHLKVIANAGQSFIVRIHAEVQGNRKGWFGSRSKAPSASVTPAPTPIPPSPPTPIPAVAVPAPPPEPVMAETPFWMTTDSSRGGGSKTRTPPPATAAAPSTMTASAPVLTPISRSGGRSGVLPPLPAPVLQPLPAAAGELAPGGSRGGIAQAVVVGAILGFVWRLLLVFPADLYARLLGSTARSPLPGSLEAWLQAPTADGDFLRLFVMATWWIGALVGVALVWRNGGRLTDLVCGVIAGAVAGLAGSATLACAVVAADAVPRALLHGALGSRVMGPALATPLWIVTATVCWLAEGAVLGLMLGVFGRAGAAVLAFVASPLVWLLRACGMTNMAEFFAMRGA